MKDEIAPTLPLNETEIDQLDDFLTSDSAPDAAMDVSMMDGFMTALASGPNLMMPGAMLGWIWDAEHGRDLPTFASADESKGIVGLIIRHWNCVNDMLNDASVGYEPLILEHESDGRVISVIDDWCEGYYKGIAVDRKAWAPVLAEHPEWFTVIMLYGTEEGWDELKRRKNNLDQHQAFAGSLARSVQDIRRYWAEQRRLQIERGGIPGVMAQREPLRRAPKVGRNDPCPCGLGKKYKRCHAVLEVATGSGRTGHGFNPEQARRVLTDAQESLIVSPLSQRVTRDGTAVEVEIYGDGKGAWLLEVVDEFGNSTVWDNSFPTDNAALAEALNVIDREGIVAVIGSPPASATRH
ncbi:UPF0149 family protein [Paraburkholderia hospita]|uniref:UPF0149 family protein n=1 Tax=Paraburkholderia hospita TaxID=169430 RepID=UPI001374D7F6|nr:UPF0149 family protein [Paraburkholderia hospita]